MENVQNLISPTKQYINSFIPKNENHKTLKIFYAENTKPEENTVVARLKNSQKSRILPVYTKEKIFFQNLKQDKNFDTLNETRYYQNVLLIRVCEQK